MRAQFILTYKMLLYFRNSVSLFNFLYRVEEVRGKCQNVQGLFQSHF